MGWMEWKKPWNEFSEAVQILETEKSRVIESCVQLGVKEMIEVVWRS